MMCLRKIKLLCFSNKRKKHEVSEIDVPGSLEIVRSGRPRPRRKRRLRWRPRRGSKRIRRAGCGHYRPDRSPDRQVQGRVRTWRQGPVQAGRCRRAAGIAHGQARTRRPPARPDHEGTAHHRYRRPRPAAEPQGVGGRRRQGRSRPDGQRFLGRVRRAGPHHAADVHAERPDVQPAVGLLRHHRRHARAGSLGQIDRHRHPRGRDRHRLPSARRPGGPDPGRL
jgi:hypothetical protein